MTPQKKLLTKFIIDLFVWSSTVPIAYSLRLDQGVTNFQKSLLFFTLVSTLIGFALLQFFGAYRYAWHRTSSRDLPVLTKAIGLWMLALYVINAFIPPELVMPRSIPLIAGMLVLLALLSVRMGYRYYFEYQQRSKFDTVLKRALIVGAGEAGVLLAKEMRRHPEMQIQPIGFLDDDPGKRKQLIIGLPVMGGIKHLPEIVASSAIDEVLIAMPSARGEIIRKIVNLCQEAGVKHRTIPGIFNLIDGSVSVAQLREVDLEDLLRRDPVRLELPEISQYIQGKTVLVTGAGGSIGSEIVRQILKFSPQRVILLGRGENSIYQIEREVRGIAPNLAVVPVICDVRNTDKLRKTFELHHPEVVFHAAAHKHVPLMEQNPDEAIVNNVQGTENLVQLSLEFRVERFVNVSTDKAINPTSVMGASKRVAEMVTARAAARATAHQAFVSVRFGNVLGSRGSVVPLFKEQIQKREPITVTHPDMTRYFMTIPEAAQLVLQAASMPEGNAKVYVLDMGEPVKVVELARDLIRLSGLVPDEDIEIRFTGIRPGEKLFEELLSAEEGSMASKHEKIFIAKNAFLGDPESFDSTLRELLSSARTGDTPLIRKKLKEIIPSLPLA